MKIVLQRVSRASVSIEDRTVSAIGPGLLALVGVEKGDTWEDVDSLAKKVAELRCFADEQGRMNRSIEETGGALLAVSQFTLAADCRKGRRPSFARAQTPDRALELFEGFVTRLAERGIPVQTGRTGRTGRPRQQAVLERP